MPARSRSAPISALTTNFDAIYPVTVTVSGVVAGQPVAVKVVDHWVVPEPNRSARRRARDAGRRAGYTVSFTWVAGESLCGTWAHGHRVNWRRTTISVRRRCRGQMWQ